MKNIHGGVLLLERLQPTKLTLIHGCFSYFQNCTNSTKSRKASHLPIRVYLKQLFYKNLYHALLKRYRKKIGKGISSSNTATDIEHTDTTIQRKDILFNPLSTNPTKWSNTLMRTNCLS